MIRLILALLLFCGSALAQTATLPTPGATGRVLPGDFGLMSASKCNYPDASICQVTSTGGTTALTHADREALRDTILNHLAAGQTPAQARAGAFDIAPALNAALAASQEVLIPCGTYQLNGAVSVTRSGTVIRGAGRNCVTFLIGSTTGDVITVGAGGAGLGVQDFQMSGVKLYSSVTRTSGALINLNGTYNATLKEILAGGPYYDGIVVTGNQNTGQAITHISDVQFVNATRSCIRLTNDPVDTFIEGRISLFGCYQGLLVEDANGLYLNNISIYGAGNVGIHFTPQASLSQKVQSVWATAVLSDTSYSNNWVFDGDGNMADIHCTACWASSSVTGYGFYIANPTLDQINFSGGSKAINNYGHGFGILGGHDITLDGVVAEMNSVAGSAQYDGIFISSTADWVTVGLSRSGLGGAIPQNNGHANFQRYGLNAGTGTDNTRHLTIVNNQFRQNVTGGFQMPTGTNIVNTGNTQ